MLGMDKLTGLSVEGNGIGVGLAKHPVHSTDYVLRGEAKLLFVEHCKEAEDNVSVGANMSFGRKVERMRKCKIR